MSAIRVLLVDDHALVRAGIHALLDRLGGVQVVAEASDGREALRLIETQPPDVVLMDIGMPGLNGLEAAARIRKEFPQVRIIVLSMYANEEYVLQALHAGAAGYLLKDAAFTELELAVKAVARGETFLSPAVSRHVVDYVRRADAEVSPPEPLTPRQREVLQLIAEGRSTRDMAQILNVSVKTVETHRAHLMKRLGIYTIAGLVRYAVRNRLIAPDEQR